MTTAKGLRSASQRPITKPNIVQDNIQVKKEPDILSKSEDEVTAQIILVEDSQNNSHVVQFSQKVKKEYAEHEQPSSATLTKYVTDSRRIIMSEKGLLVNTGGEQAGTTSIYQRNEESNDPFGEDDSESEMDDENDSDFEWSEDEDEDEDGDGNKTTKTAAKEPFRKRGPVVKTAREFIARLHRKQDEAAQRKRKRRRNKRKTGATNGKESKRQKTTNISFDSDILAPFTHDMMMGELDDGELLAPAMPEIDADTHQKQFALLKDSIPEGADTRRTKTQGRDLKEAVKLFGYRKVKASSGKWLLKGMKTALYGHQLTAAAWMIKRECARAGPYGGLIADEMGMGKTLSSLACVIGNPPEPDDLETYVKSTLVIAPNFDIAEQWLSEVQQHCMASIADHVMVYKSKSNIPAGVCRGLTMAITTTKEVQSYFQRVQSNKLRNNEVLGFHWYRVILDEAHSIKNLKSLTKQSMAALKAKHCWALTGTPLSNSATEFISYLKFVGFDVEESKKKFRKEYMNQSKANEKFETLISSFTYRRTHRDTFLGHAILPIPPLETHDIWVPLTVEEDAIYSFVKKLSSSKVDEEQDKKEKPRQAKKGKPEILEGKSKKEISNQNVRRRSMYMRCLISHPYNIERLLRKLEEARQVQELRNSIKQCNSTNTVLQQLLSNDDARASLERYKSGLDEMKKCTNIAFGGVFKFDEHLLAIQKELKVRDTRCIKCRASNPKYPVTPSECRHLYCGACLTKRIESQKFGKHTKKNPFTCIARACTSPLLPANKLLTMSSIVDDASTREEYAPPDVDSNKVTLPREKDQIGCFVASCLSTEPAMVPNARLTTAMTVLLSWRVDYPDDKIIVFTENVMTAKVFGSMLNHAHIGFVYYYGCMSSEKKAKALGLFRESQGTNVFLSGLKSGGQSLNITCANRVIIIDPWWNVTSELQAAGRTSRIGQTKHCYVVRIFTSAATDERVAQLQKFKSEEVDYALQDDGHVPQVLDYNKSLKLFDRTRGTDEPYQVVDSRNTKVQSIQEGDGKLKKGCAGNLQQLKLDVGRMA